MKKLWIVSSYKTDFSWVENYTQDYIVYDKSKEFIETDKIKHSENVGYNIYDYMRYITENYDNIADVCVFIKSNIWNRTVDGIPNPHCSKEKFDRLISNNIFTPLESYENIPITRINKKDIDGGYVELNEPEKPYHPWYTQDRTGLLVCKYFKKLEEMLPTVFTNPIIPRWVRFSPGANYIVPKENILYYSKSVYEKLKKYVEHSQYSAESHMIERALYLIFTNYWKE